MPKIVDHYILEEKIGAGQFGDVYRGYHEITKQEVAVKTIRRETIKGKFYELLENEIKVLKTCDNPNIIKLYAIKKTANHFYLMLEYCNQGDMLAYIRKTGTLPEEKAIKFFCQILNAFQDMVKHKIMHRDFKLANILMHEGNIKIADFGFAKLLNTEDYATTMLGSPLNMAPEVLGGNKYNSKADIWSIGACLWEMIYGKPPYVANNMVDLLNIIKTKPLKFPPNPKLNDILMDVIKKMLVADARKRISWNDLFNHPINAYLANQLRQEINLELIEDESLVLNTSKLYLKKNMVIENPADIQENEEMNEYLRSVIKTGKKEEEFKPSLSSISPSRQSRTESETKTVHTQKIEQKTEKEEKTDKSQIQEKKKVENLEKSEKVENNQVNKSALQICFRNNMKKIMHFRNVYVFLANISDMVLSSNELKDLGIEESDNEIVAYYLVQNILTKIKNLLEDIKKEECPFDGFEFWEEFKESKELAEVNDYISKELEIFSVFNQSLLPAIKKGVLDGKYGAEVKKLVNGDFVAADYRFHLEKYSKNISKQLVINMLKEKQTSKFKNALKQVEFCFLALDTDVSFGKGDFNFNEFYDNFNICNAEESLLRIEKLIQNL